MSLRRAQLAYQQAAIMVGIPYIFGGAHGVTDFRRPSVWRRGVDCASGASVVLSAGGMLARPRALYALDTEEFETWGEEGLGEYLGLYVLDSGATHHCALWFNPDYFEHEYWQATNPTDGVGFIAFSPEGFHSRHWVD